MPTCCSLTIFLHSLAFLDLVFYFHFLYTYPRISRDFTGRQLLRMLYCIWVIWVESVETRDVSHPNKGLEDIELVTEDSCSVAGLQGKWAMGTVGYWDSGLQGQWAKGTVGYRDSGINVTWSHLTVPTIVRGEISKGAVG